MSEKSMEYTAVNPRQTPHGILLDLEVPGMDDPLQFLASDRDVEPHGRDLYARAMAGEFGDIVPYDEPPSPSPADTIKAQILDLEALQTPRRMREAAIGIDNGWLAALEAEIAVLRAQLPDE